VNRIAPNGLPIFVLWQACYWAREGQGVRPQKIPRIVRVVLLRRNSLGCELVAADVPVTGTQIAAGQERHKLWAARICSWFRSDQQDVHPIQKCAKTQTLVLTDGPAELTLATWAPYCLGGVAIANSAQP
jgi:hypothetical protein